MKKWKKMILKRLKMYKKIKKLNNKKLMIKKQKMKKLMEMKI